jgi:hypothetical protein
MTANAEARSLLDQLMGADRDAPLPRGAALPRNSKRPLVGGATLDGGVGGMILPGSKKTKSCYDRDIDPLYCAWGLDVYDLFVNTKSDLGPNPYTVDEAARKEYLSLPREEQDLLGFEGHLFVKLQELVQHCDRTVARNQDKLQRELQRQSQKRGGNDYVMDVNEGAVEELLRTEIRVQEMKDDLKEALGTLRSVRSIEEAILEEQRQEQKKKLNSEADTHGAKEGSSSMETQEEKEPTNESNDASATFKNEEDEHFKDEDTEDKTSVPAASNATVKTDDTAMNTIDTEEVKNDPDATMENDDGLAEKGDHPIMSLEELGRLTLERQGLLCKIANIMSQIGPLEDSIEVQYKNLNYVKSDTTTDKTVCEVSGNFMSARDADERIAAHYAGKQYVGWKLVRGKFQGMIKKYGKYGPPRGGGGGVRGMGGGGGGPPLLSHQQYQQQQTHRGPPPRGQPPPSSDSGRGVGGGGLDRRDPGRWERGGGGNDRGYDDRERGGGYDRRRVNDQRNGGGAGGGGQYGSSSRGGGGSYGRR